MKIRWFTLLRALALGLICCVAQAQDGNAEARAKYQAAAAAALAVQKVGPTEILLLDQARLNLPDGYAFIPVKEAGEWMRSMGNRVDSSFLGLVISTKAEPWLITIEFQKEGFIKDDDAKNWDADDLLKSLKEGTEAGNAERTQRGFPAIEVVGWAQKPTYDAVTHRLVWSAVARDKGNTNAADQGVNFKTYALGRDGFMSLNLITELDQLAAHRPAALSVLEALQYNEGKRYVDYNAATDKVAAYGLAALVAGAAAKKLGLIAVILAFLAKFAKVFIVLGGALVWGLVKVFRKKPEPEPTFEDTVPASRVSSTTGPSSSSRSPTGDSSSKN